MSALYIYLGSHSIRSHQPPHPPKSHPPILSRPPNQLTLLISDEWSQIVDKSQLKIQRMSDRGHPCDPSVLMLVLQRIISSYTPTPSKVIVITPLFTPPSIDSIILQSLPPSTQYTRLPYPLLYSPSCLVKSGSSPTQICCVYGKILPLTAVTQHVSGRALTAALGELLAYQQLDIRDNVDVLEDLKRKCFDLNGGVGWYRVEGKGVLGEWIEDGDFGEIAEGGAEDEGEGKGEGEGEGEGEGTARAAEKAGGGGDGDDDASLSSEDESEADKKARLLSERAARAARAERLASCQSIRVDSLRRTLPHLILNPAPLAPSITLAESVALSISRSPAWLHPMMWANVILIGGNFSIPGLFEAAVAEITAVCPEEYKEVLSVRRGQSQIEAAAGWSGVEGLKFVTKATFESGDDWDVVGDYYDDGEISGVANVEEARKRLGIVQQTSRGGVNIAVVKVETEIENGDDKKSDSKKANGKKSDKKSKTEPKTQAETKTKAKAKTETKASKKPASKAKAPAKPKTKSARKKAAAPAPFQPVYKPGDKVEARFQKGNLWYPGFLVRVGETFDVSYDDGDYEGGVEPKFVRPRTPPPQTKKQGK